MPTDRLTLSQLLDRSPSSSGFHLLVLSSRAYGLTTGGKNANEFGLTSVGRDAVGDDPGTRQAALRQAVLNVEPFRAFLTAYDKKKIPAPAALKAFLTGQAGVPNERVEEAVTHLHADARTAGVIRTVKGTEYVDLQATTAVAASATDDSDGPAEDVPDELDAAEELEAKGETHGLLTPPVAPQLTTTPKVFITHGKNHEIVAQLEELLRFGKFEPVVAQQHETPAKPVPEKVMEDMRTCSAAVIHVATEELLLDRQGDEHAKINENVLIEIGAAMALYGRNFILLVPKGLTLPSNLQGLYRCEYEGDSLDYEATMKLLKAFNEFR